MDNFSRQNNKKQLKEWKEKINIPSEQWFELLQNDSVFRKEDKDLMEALFKCKECCETASTLAIILGVAGHGVLNLQIGRLGKRIKNELPNVKFPTRKDETIRWWNIPFWGEEAEKKGNYYWELRPELKEALEKFFNEDKPKIQDFNQYNENLEKELAIAMNLPEEEQSKHLKNYPVIPDRHEASATVYKRNPYVIIKVLERANGYCEHCNNPAPFFKSKDKRPYLEVHHKIQLAKGGEDTVDNAIALCPNCHRHAHYGSDTF